LGLNRSLKSDALGFYNIPSESASGGNAVFDDLKDHDVNR